MENKKSNEFAVACVGSAGFYKYGNLRDVCKIQMINS